MVGDTLRYCRAKVSNDVEGSFEMLFVRTAAVRREEGHGGSEIRASVCCEPGEAADQGLVGVSALDEAWFLLVDDGGRDAVDGTAGSVRSTDRVEVNVL